MQTAVDDLFESKAPYHTFDEEVIEERNARAGRSLSVLLAEQVRQRLGEDYAVSQEDQFFYLAQRQRPNTSGEFDPREELGISASADYDLRTGRVTVDFDVNAQSRKPRGARHQDDYGQPVLENIQVEIAASPEAVKRVHEKLEAEYQQEVAEYERQVAAFRQLAGWVRGRKEDLGPKDWAEQPLLKVLWPGAEGAECKIGLYPSDDGREEIRLVVFEPDSKAIYDVSAKQEPVRPERWFESKDKPQS